MSEENENVNEAPVGMTLEQKVELNVMEEEDSGNSDAFAKHNKKLLDEKKKADRKFRDSQAELDALRNQMEDMERLKLEEKQEYKALYERAQAELKQEREDSLRQKKEIVNSTKRKALEKELGGLKKEQYFTFANLDNIVVEDDGSINSDSVRYEANIFRQNHPELVRVTNIPNVNNVAPSAEGININNKKGANEMSSSERAAARTAALRASKN